MCVVSDNIIKNRNKHGFLTFGLGRAIKKPLMFGRRFASAFFVALSLLFLGLLFFSSFSFRWFVVYAICCETL